MNSRAETRAWHEPTREVMSAYLEDLSRRLAGRMPSGDCHAFIQEAAEHLERLQEDARMAGHEGKASAEQAVVAFGEVSEIADTFVEGWLAGTRAGRISRRFGFSRTVAFAWFAMAETVCIALLLVRMYVPSTDALPIVASPAQLRALLPSPLPTPDLTGIYFALLGAQIGLPILAGIMVGRSLPNGAALWSLRAILVTIAYTAALGLSMGTEREVVHFAFWQAIFWLPAGALAAHLSSLRARRRSGTPALEHRPIT